MIVDDEHELAEQEVCHEFADQPPQVAIQAAEAAAQMTVSEEQRRADAPQRLFRMVNERIRHLNKPFSSSVKASWYCECANGECFERVDMLLADYEDLQRHADRFLVAPDAAHVSPEIENVIERQHSHWVVQKIGNARPDGNSSRAPGPRPMQTSR